MSNLYPKFSQKMQMEIIDILLKHIYDSDCRRRANILVKKGMLHRACGIGGLESSISSLSEAIESIVSNWHLLLSLSPLIVVWHCFIVWARPKERSPLRLCLRGGTSV
uniref:Uncharacterized protein n=1 Tax=Opuntia streptacantha TaxID=393608 RepID=A0A7C9A9D7_OPUST